jgi:Ca-activated chloride channel family protein
MKFAEPIWLVIGLAACGFLVWAWHRYDRRQRAALGVFAAGHLHAALTSSFSVARRNWKRGLFLASVALMFLALARPQAGYRWEETKRRGIEILFAVDTSKSMLTPDVKPDRLTRAKLAVDDFVNRLDGDGVGLVAFAGNAFLQCPITLDYNAFNDSLAALDTNTIARGGTNISSAIQEAEAALQNRPSTDKILILLTDGEDLEGNALEEAKAAAQAGLKIYTVGVGTANGDLIPLPAESGGGFVKDDAGQYVKSHLDEKTLQAIAQATGGIYAPLGAQGEGLDTIYQQALAPLKKHDLASRAERVYIERYQWCLAPALLLLLASLLVGTRRSTKRVRRTHTIPIPTMPTRRRSRMPQAVAALVGAALLLSTQARASVSQAEAAYQKGDYAVAEKAFEAAAQNPAQRNALQYDAGTAAYKAGQFAQAAEDFQKSLEMKQSSDPKQLDAQEDAYYNLGNTLYRNGQKTEKQNVQQTIQTWGQAIKSYDAALQLRTDDADSKFNRDLVQKKLDALKKQQQQQQKQAQQKQSQSPANKSQQDQNQQAQNQQGKSGQNSPNRDQKTASNPGGGQGQPQPPKDRQPQSQNQVSNGTGDQNSKSKPSQQKNPGEQPNQQNTAQNSGDKQPGTGSQPNQQQGQQASNQGQKQTPQNQGGQQPASAQPNGGSAMAQNGRQPSGQTAAASEQRTPGQMSRQEARQLLDSLRGEQKPLPGNAVARDGTDNNNTDQPIKDW